jgi:hypothetical protein
MDSIDTDINNYSINELKEIFNLEKDLINVEILKRAYDKKIETNNELENIEIRDKLNSFFKDVYKFLQENLEGNNKKENLEDKIIKERDRDIEKLEDKLSYLVDFNYKSNPNKLDNIISTDQINQSNIQVNPRTYNIIKKQLAINSEFRKKTDSYLRKIKEKVNSGVSQDSFIVGDSSTDFIIELPEPIDNVISMQLVHIEIPNLLNTFSERKCNDEFKIKIENELNGDEYNISIKIPRGIWLVGNLIDYFSENYFDKDILVNPFDDSLGLKNEYLRYLKFDILEHSGKSIFRFKTDLEIKEFNDEAFGLNSDYIYDLSTNIRNNLSYTLENIIKEINCNNLEKDTHQYKGKNVKEINFCFTTLGTFGYDYNQIYDGSNNSIKIRYSDTRYTNKLSDLISYRGYIESLKIYGHTHDSGLYISVNDFIGNHGQQILLMGYDSRLVSDNILSRIAVKIQPFQNLLFNSLTDYDIKREYYGGVKIRKLHVQVLDKYGRVVDLSDYPTNFVFEFTIQYSSERLSIFRNKM